MSEKRSTKCGVRLLVNANFCPNCGASLKPQVISRKGGTGFVTAAGVLLILASCLSAVNGIVAFMVSYMMLNMGYGFHLYDSAWYMLAFGVLAIFSSGMGLTAGALSFKRKQFGFAASGAALLLITSVWQSSSDPFPGGYWPGFLARAIFPLSLLSLILVFPQRREFT